MIRFIHLLELGILEPLLFLLSHESQSNCEPHRVAQNNTHVAVNVGYSSLRWVLDSLKRIEFFVCAL